MIPLTVPRLLRIMPRCAPVATTFIGLLNQAFVKWRITSSHSMAAFLAQAAYESGELLRLEENLNYSTERLLQVFPSRFTRALAEVCAGKPDEIAAVVYSGRFGNGGLLSGDGFRYRGRGIFQITFRDNYAACERATGIHCVNHPDLLTVPTYAVEAAGWYWHSRGLSSEKSFDAITRKIAGSLQGIEHRTMYLKRAEAALMT